MNRLIVFEGGEGSGKSSHIELTKLWLEKQGQTVLSTHEPGGTSLGQKIRSAILESATGSEITHRAELLLFLADRAQHISEVIAPALDSGTTVLCDRFSGSTFAYQVGGRGLSAAEIAPLDTYARNGVEPDIVLYLDVDPEVGIGRKHNQPGDNITKFEEEEVSFHRAVRAEFQALAQQDSWFQVDANQSLDTAQKQIEKILTKQFA